MNRIIAECSFYCGGVASSRGLKCKINFSLEMIAETSELSVMDVTKISKRIFHCPVSQFDQSNHRAVHPSKCHVHATVIDSANPITDGTI